MEQLTVLPEFFYQKKVQSLANVWQDLQNKVIKSFEWSKAGIKKETKVFKADDVIVNPRWQQFFCLMSGCLPPSISPVMRTISLTDQEFEKQKKESDRTLSVAGKVFYFKTDTYRLEIVTPEKRKFIFITRLKDIYP